MKKYSTVLIYLLFTFCQPADNVKDALTDVPVISVTVPSLVVLGTVQDAGSPHIGCKKECCADLFLHPDKNRRVVSLGVVDPENKMNWIFEATPDFTLQLKSLNEHSSFRVNEPPDGIFLTHAHMGHYTGLMYLGREAFGSKDVSVYAMPEMKSYLENNGPWSQLVALNNIQLTELRADEIVQLSSNIRVRPFLVPHRDEFSETVGYVIEGPTKKVLFIPDINKWEKWERSIVEEIEKVDYAFIDASFYDAAEIDNRDIKEIPHPFVIETMNLLENLSESEKVKVYFIHFNHTNPLLNIGSIQAQEVVKAGFKISETGLCLPL